DPRSGVRRPQGLHQQLCLPIGLPRRSTAQIADPPQPGRHTESANDAPGDPHQISAPEPDSVHAVEQPRPTSLDALDKSKPSYEGVTDVKGLDAKGLYHAYHEREPELENGSAGFDKAVRDANLDYNRDSNRRVEAGAEAPIGRALAVFEGVHIGRGAVR